MKEASQFAVTVIVEFSAAHRIRDYDGECARPHGHNWKIHVDATTPKLNNIGIAVDFKILKGLVKELIGEYDHQDLNTIKPFDVLNPTAENLAMVIFQSLAGEINKLKELSELSLKKVTVWENDRSAASFGLVS